MSTVKAKNHQIGSDGTASNNFTIYQPSTPDGTSRWAVGVSGATTADVVTVNSSGNVGIGTSSPSAKLHVRASSTGSTAYGIMLDAGAQQHSWYLSDNTTSAFTIGSTAGQFTWANSGGERMRIDSSGNVLIGTTSFSTTPHKQVISTTSDYQLAINSTDTSNGYSTITFSNGGTTECQIYYYKTNDRLYIVNSSAGVYLANAGTSWTSNSDERKKDIIEPIENAAEKVTTLRAVIGKYKTDAEGTRRPFLIAQDVQAVLPEAVDAKDPEDLGVQYTDVIPLLVAAIQEQQTIIKDLKARIETLEAK